MNYGHKHKRKMNLKTRENWKVDEMFTGRKMR